MKKRLVSLSIIWFLIFLTSCNSNNETTIVKDGTYVLQTEKEIGLSPRVTISGDYITFSYDPLSSYVPIGVYKIEKDLLTMMTDDGKYKYIFHIDGDKLFFQKDESSEVDLINERLGIKIINNAEFMLIED